jgi:outer membrane protein insertion porin family
MRWNLLYEDTDLSDYPLQFLINPELRSLTEDSKTLSLGWSIERNTTNNYVDPSTGSIHKLALQVAGFGVDNEFVKLEHDSSWFFPLSEEQKWVLSYRTRQGWITPYGSQDEIRLQDRYYVGGTTTVRGYDNRDIGPKTKTYLFWGEDFRMGGEARIVNNLEVKYKLNDMFRVYGFSDAGGVWYEASDFDLGDMRYSVGLGIGVDVPRMGPVRLDYGFPLNPDDDQGSGRLHLTTGFRF